MEKKTLCPVCQSVKISHVISRKQVPVHQNLLMDTPQEARSINRGDLDICMCLECGFVFNQSFNSTKMNYGLNYNNCQTVSPYFQQYINNLVASISRKNGDKKKHVVEVGCGKGDFLRKLIEEDDNVTGYGFDPSYEGIDKVSPRLEFIKDFFGPKYTHIGADVIICRHVIEHISNPMELLLSIRETLKNATDSSIYFETPCVNWIFKNQVTWDFFYEHCSLFTKSSLTTLFELAGFHVEKVDHVFGGQYLWLEASVGKQKVDVDSTSSMTLELANEYAKKEKEVIEGLCSKIREYSRTNQLALWGAGAKGVTLINLIDPSKELFDCIVDINPQKQGKFLAGTGHAIISYKELNTRNVGMVIVLNPNYTSEIAQLLGELNSNIKIVELS